MSTCCCSFVVVKSERLAEAARACLQEVMSAQRTRQQALDIRVGLDLYRAKNRWYHFGRNKLYVPTQEEIDREREADHPWYNMLDGGFSKYPEKGADIRLRCIKEVAERLLSAARLGETVSVSIQDLHTISYLQETQG